MWLKCVPTQGYHVDYSGDVDPGPFEHYFCGNHNIRGAWCPNCEKPLLRTLLLDTSDPRVELTDSPFASLPLLYCWTCMLAHEKPFCYRLLDDGAVELIRYGKGGQTDSFPYRDYPIAFPGCKIGLTPVSKEIQEALDWHHAGPITPEFEERYDPILKDVYDSEPRTQVGGAPFLFQGKPEYLCPRCGDQFALLATVFADNLDPRGFNPIGAQCLFLYCLACHVVAALHECS